MGKERDRGTNFETHNLRDNTGLLQFDSSKWILEMREDETLSY